VFLGWAFWPSMLGVESVWEVTHVTHVALLSHDWLSLGNVTSLDLSLADIFQT
jgi:hypothetical protein